MKNKRVIIIGILLLSVAAFYGLVKFNVVNFQDDTIAVSNEPTPEQKEAETKTNSSSKESLIEEQKQEQPTETNPAPTEDGIELTARTEDNGTVTILTKLQKITDGTCVLSIKNGTKAENQAADVIFQPQYSTCAGFSVPVSKLGTGEWTISLTVDSNGSSVTKTISHKVQ